MRLKLLFVISPFPPGKFQPFGQLATYICQLIQLTLPPLQPESEQPSFAPTPLLTPDHSCNREGEKETTPEVENIFISREENHQPQKM